MALTAARLWLKSDRDMGRGRTYFNISQGNPTACSAAPLRKIPLSASIALALAAASLAACAPTVDQRGNLPDPDKLAQIHPGTTTREQVAKILGTPSSTGVFDDKNWYYISRRTQQVAFFDPDVLDQQVYIVNFDDKGVVRGVDHKDLKDGRGYRAGPRSHPGAGARADLCRTGARQHRPLQQGQLRAAAAAAAAAAPRAATGRRWDARTGKTGASDGRARGEPAHAIA